MAVQINGTTGLSGVDGSATTPALQGSDTNTGLTFGTDTVGVVTGGTTRTTVDSSGRLLVGSAAISSPKCDPSGIDLSNGNLTIVGGADSTLLTRTNSTRKDMRIGCVHYTNAEEPVIGLNFISDGSTNAVHIGGGTGLGNAATQLQFYTAANQTTTTGTERMKITNDGRVGVNATNFTNGRLITESDGSAVTPFVIRDTASGTGSVNSVGFFRNTTQVGSIALTGSATAYNTSSDYRLKENVVPLTGAADRLNQLQVRRFNFIADPDTTVDGFIAHEAQAVVPEAVTGTQDEVEIWKEGEELPDGVSVGDNKLDEDGNTIPVYQGIDQSKFVPLLTAALQEALAKIETLETRLTALEGGAS